MWTKYAYNRKHSNILLFLVKNLTYYHVKMHTYYRGKSVVTTTMEVEILHYVRYKPQGANKHDLKNMTNVTRMVTWKPD